MYLHWFMHENRISIPFYLPIVHAGRFFLSCLGDMSGGQERHYINSLLPRSPRQERIYVITLLPRWPRKERFYVVSLLPGWEGENLCSVSPARVGRREISPYHFSPHSKRNFFSRENARKARCNRLFLLNRNKSPYWSYHLKVIRPDKT